MKGLKMMTSKSKRRLTHAMLPFRREGLERVIPLGRGITVRALFNHKKHRALLDQFVCVMCDRGLWHHRSEIEKGFAR